MIVAPFIVLCAALTIAILFLLFVAPAFAYGPDTWNTSAMSELTIMESDKPGCPAEILIENRQSDYLPDMRGTLELNDIVIGTRYFLNMDLLGSEEYHFTPLTGNYVVIPPEIVVQDDHDATVYVCEFMGF